MTVTYIDLDAAKAAKGTRMVSNGLVPSPWSEAAKGLFRIAKVPVVAVRRLLDVAAIDAWTGVDNSPVVLHDREPVRTHWAAITTLAARLGAGLGGPPLLPSAPAERSAAIGVLHEIAGEDGIGWNARLAMIDAGLTSNGSRGFPLVVAKYLGKRYGYSPERVAAARERVTSQLAYLAGELAAREAAGHGFFGGAAPSAIDVYLATFLTPVAAPITEAECPQLQPMLRQAFATSHEAFGALVPASLLAHRERMFDGYLPRPIDL